jgi:NADPH-dependent 2,4-dienoyl-CoA reductase/sulfur reductase-like enzyme
VSAGSAAALAPADVVIVGGGPAGLSAARELRRRGAGRVVVIERELEPGGIPRHAVHPGFGLRDLHRSLTGPDYARRLADRAAEAGVELLTGTQATGWSGELELELTGPGGRRTLLGAAVVLATGCRERPRSARLIPGTRPDGVMTTGTLQQLVHLEGARLSGRAVIVGAEHVSYSALDTIEHGGAQAVAIVTEHARHQTFAAFAAGAALRYRARLRTRTALTGIHGSGRVQAVTLTNLATGVAEVVACELVVLTAGWIPDHELAVSAGVPLDRGTRGPVVDACHRTPVPGVFAAGNVVQGAEPADVAAMQGRNVAAAVLRQLERRPWPPAPVPIRCVEPLHWLVPNAITAGEPAPPFARLRASEILHDARVEVLQGERVLHRQHLRRVMPGRSARLATAWAAAVDAAGPPVLVRVASARRHAVGTRASTN